jgi:hypothetical protein
MADDKTQANTQPPRSVSEVQISPLLREQVNKQSPAIQAGIADIVARKKGDASS